ncbi:hypothetical protein COT12_00030 [Candidatus Berkelbacteria bacterium CG08_land_8_20_14_0_20_39_8]|uniref:Uncharacterized protein n=1 Tax=Candidatus Berkelbacteria bacterium CG08_land_8_20_14_0_20_39_8 TaxID=1974511 RepID=A0A2M6YD99_9BACT|nr:MAG: hypothetical protein COT12_00030 [Candidatus Berkelbacteria bacterium CG08_land_8_20_14_0_20_39_8]
MKFLKFITNNWPIKLLAVFAALGLWAYAASVKISVATFPNDIPIKALNLTPGFVAIFDQDTVKISISAASDTWNQLSTDSFSAYIDLNGYSVGTYQIPINITTSVSGVLIISRDPLNATVTIEPSISKDVSVVAKISGEAAENMIVSNAVFDPQTVRVTGPKSAIDSLSQATAEIILSGESSDFSNSVTVSALNQSGGEIQNVYFAPMKVMAEVKIVSAGNVKNLGISVDTKGSPADGFYISSISTNPATISVVGAANSVRNLNTISTVPIDITNLSQTLSGTYALIFPLGVQSNGTNKVSVTITVSNQTINRTLSIPIKTPNIPSGLSVSSITPPTVLTTVSGPINTINSIGISDISLSIDLSTAVSGNHDHKISSDDFTLSDNIKLINFTPSTVTISLK